MCAQEAKCNWIINLLDAHTPQKEIAKIVCVSERTVRHIQHAKKLGRGTKRSPGSGGHHRKRSKVFLKTLQEKITEDPTVSMRKHVDFKCRPKDHKNCCHPGLGPQIFFQAARISSHQEHKAKKV